MCACNLKAALASICLAVAGTRFECNRSQEEGTAKLRISL